MILRRLLTIIIFLMSGIWSQAQQINPVPDYVFRNQMSVGRNAVTDTGAYFSIGPRYGAVKGFMPPIVGDTASVNANKRNGLLIFSVQKNKFLYWDSVRVQWSDMAGSSGSYITGSGITGYVPQFNGTTTIDTSALFTLGNRLGVGTSSFVYNTTSTANVELNGTAGGILGFKRNDSARGYLWHTGDNMELANTVAGSISFNTNSATRGSIASDGVWRLHNLAGTGDRVVQASSNGTLSATASVTGLVDTLTISTRAWRQKGIDSVAGLSRVGGSGTTNYVPKFTAGSTIGNSQIVDNAASGVSIGAKTLIRDDGPFITGSNISGGANNMAIGTPTSGGFLSAYTNATERLRIFANGRVFVGASPTDAGYQLDVNGTFRTTGSSAAQMAVNTTNASGTALIHQQSGSSVGWVGNGGSSVIGGSTSDYGINSQASLFLATGGYRAATVTLAGDMGIGTSSPSYKLDINGTLRSVNGANFATTSGNVGIGTTSPTTPLTVLGRGTFTDANGGVIIGQYASVPGFGGIYSTQVTPSGSNYNFLVSGTNTYISSPNGFIRFDNAGTERGRINSAGEWIIDASGTDAGDYKLQVVGNARIGTGKLDIASNTTFGIGVARSGTSEVAGQIYNSSGILYLGAESSAGGQIFTGSSAYAAVIGSGAAYPLQFAANNITRATLTTNGNLMIGFPTDTYFYRLQVNGSIFSNNQIIAQNAAAQLNIDSSTNISPLYISNQSLTDSSAQGLFYGSTTWNTTGNPSLIDLAITNTASGSNANYIKISDGSNIFRVTKAAEVVTAAPTGGSIRKWKLGEAATVSPTSPDRTIRVEIDGTVYYLHAKTTND